MYIFESYKPAKEGFEQDCAMAATLIEQAVILFASDKAYEDEVLWNITGLTRLSNGEPYRSTPLGMRITAEAPGRSEQVFTLQIKFDDPRSRMFHSEQDWYEYIRTNLESLLRGEMDIKNQNCPKNFRLYPLR